MAFGALQRLTWTAEMGAPEMFITGDWIFWWISQAESRCLLDAVREASAGVPFVGEPQWFSRWLRRNLCCNMPYWILPLRTVTINLRGDAVLFLGDAGRYVHYTLPDLLISRYPSLSLCFGEDVLHTVLHRRCSSVKWWSLRGNAHPLWWLQGWCQRFGCCHPMAWWPGSGR